MLKKKKKLGKQKFKNIFFNYQPNFQSYLLCEFSFCKQILFLLFCLQFDIRFNKMSSSLNPNEERTVFCYILEEKIDSENTKVIKPNKNIFFRFSIPSEDYLLDSLTKIALLEIQKIYPGVEMIDLYLPKTFYNRFIKSTKIKETFVCLNEPDILLNSEQNYQNLW